MTQFPHFHMEVKLDLRTMIVVLSFRSCVSTYSLLEAIQGFGKHYCYHLQGKYGWVHFEAQNRGTQKVTS
jgi:hypothetical protein